MRTQDTHSTHEGTQEEQTMKKNTQAAVLSVKMNDQFQINAAVNHWNEHKSWVRILNELGFAYRTESTDNRTKFVVHDRHDPENVYGVVEEYSSGEQSKHMVELSDGMRAKLNTGESSVDRKEFLCGYIFFGDREKMLKKEIIPFYERHLRDLAAEEIG